MAKITPLNYDWLFWELNQTDENSQDKAEKVNLPHNAATMPINNFSDKLYNKKVCYSKNIYLATLAQKTIIHFDAVAHSCKVYINDFFVGCHNGGYTAFNIDITSRIIVGTNLIRVEVDCSENQNFPPFGGQIDFMTFGGIYREVSLIESVSNEAMQCGARAIAHNVIEFFGSCESGSMTFELWDNQELVGSFSAGKHSFSYVPWSIENPKLYVVKVKTAGGEQTQFSTGFRIVRVAKDGFYLNEKKVFLEGLNRHQSYPYLGYAAPEELQKEDARLLKKMVNCVRSSHYPQGKDFYDECDKIGLLVLCEAPGWQFVGDSEWQKEYLKNVEDMIKENINHPSIIMWGVRVNESGDYEELYKNSNLLAKKFDTRNTFGVRCFSHSILHEDVYSYNDFHFNGFNNSLRGRNNVCDKSATYLITEFNGHMFPTKTTDGEQRLTEQALRYLRIINDSKNGEAIGAFGWCAFDYYTHSDFGSGDGICYHGIMDSYRNPKPAAYAYLSQGEEGVMEVLTSMNIGNFSCSYIDKAVVLTNCDFVRLYRGDTLIGDYFPDFTNYPFLKHPPIIIDDFYGDAFLKAGYSSEAAKRLKLIGSAIARAGGTDKFNCPEEAEGASKEEFDCAWNMYGERIAGWGKPFCGYTFVGYKNGKILSSVRKEPVRETKLRINYNAEILLGNTFGVNKVDISLTDQNGNILQNAYDAFVVVAEGGVQVVGDIALALIAGRNSFYVKAENVGSGSITIKYKEEQHILKFKIINNTGV